MLTVCHLKNNFSEWFQSASIEFWKEPNGINPFHSHLNELEFQQVCRVDFSIIIIYCVFKYILI
jgi:hypothetical protein